MAWMDERRSRVQTHHILLQMCKRELLLVSLICTVFAKSVNLTSMAQMRVLDEPGSNNVFGYQDAAGQGQGLAGPSSLHMKVLPGNVSGPSLLQKLSKKCFTNTIHNYKYEFCPFNNISQHEQSFRWNPYSGVLGVWYEWEIVNNTFHAMVMKHGDDCGDKQRSTKVFFKCGRRNEIVNVTEPEKCQYRLMFSTPYVCHKQAMLVYPRLSATLQNKWDIVENEFSRKFLTEKEYQQELRKIFVSAGLCLTDEQQNNIENSKIKIEADFAQTNQDTAADFYNLQTCNEEYGKMKKENERLKLLLESGNPHTHGNKSTVPAADHV